MWRNNSLCAHGAVVAIHVALFAVDLCQYYFSLKCTMSAEKLLLLPLDQVASQSRTCFVDTLTKARQDTTQGPEISQSLTNTSELSSASLSVPAAMLDPDDPTENLAVGTDRQGSVIPTELQLALVPTCGLHGSMTA